MTFSSNEFGVGGRLHLFQVHSVTLRYIVHTLANNVPLVNPRRIIGLRRQCGSNIGGDILGRHASGAPTKTTTRWQSTFLYRAPTPHRTHPQKAPAAKSCTITNKSWKIISDTLDLAEPGSFGSLVLPSGPSVCGGTPLGVVVEPLVFVPAGHVADSGRSASCVAASSSIVVFAPCNDVSCK